MRRAAPPLRRLLDEVPISAILADDAWNTRDPESSDDAADEALRASIEREGVLQPLGVSREKDKFRLVFGFRRLRAAKAAGLVRVPCVEVLPERAREANLAENAIRKQLSPWELLEALAKAREERPKEPTEDLAKSVGLAPSHVANLLRLRRKLCPELLDAYRERGETMHLRYLLKVCVLPHADQPEAYSALVTGSRGGRPAGAESGSKPPKGLAEPKHVRRWIKDLEKAEPSPFTRGARMALDCVLGRRAWLLAPASDTE